MMTKSLLLKAGQLETMLSVLVLSLMIGSIYQALGRLKLNKNPEQDQVKKT